MFFVIDKPKLQRIVALIRDDRTVESRAQGGHYMRLEASQGQLTVAGPTAEASIPATVYEDGVLFLRVTRFRRLLAAITGQKMLTIQANGDGLFLDSARLFLEANDMLLYADPAKAPAQCPLEAPAEQRPGSPPPGLFDE